MADYEYEFCQYVHTDGRRCTLAFGHSDEHQVQPQSSATVQAITRRETVLRRMGDPVSAERIVKAIDTAVQEQHSSAWERKAAAETRGIIEQKQPEVPIIEDPPTAPIIEEPPTAPIVEPTTEEVNEPKSAK